MRKIILSLILSLFTSPVLGQMDSIDKLTDNYNKAIERAVKPINDTYQDELKKLLADYSKKGELDKVNKITTILNGISDKPIAAKKIESLFVDKTWRSNVGTVFVFSENGTGTKTYGPETIPLTWRIVDKGLVEISTRNTAKSPIRQWVFRFINETTGEYGDSDGLLDKSVSASK